MHHRWSYFSFRASVACFDTNNENPLAIQAFFSETAPDIRFHPFGQNLFIRYKVVSETAVEKVVFPLINVTNRNLSHFTTVAVSTMQNAGLCTVDFWKYNQEPVISSFSV